MRKSLLGIIGLALISVTCKNLDSADPSPRSTFIKFYENSYSMTAAAIEKIPGGFVILANMVSTNPDSTLTQTLLIETDERGSRIRETKINDLIGKSLKPVIQNGVATNFIVVCDFVIIDPNVDQAANVSISSIEVLILDADYSIDRRYSISDTKPLTPNNPVKDDYCGGSVNVNEDGKAVILGTFKKGIINQQNSPEEQLLFGLDETLDSVWIKTYPLLTNTYANAKSIHYSKDEIIWATAVADVQGDFTSSYVAIPRVREQSVPISSDPIGETGTQLFLPADIQRASSAEFGYGVVGTYSQITDGSKGNIFFFIVDQNGVIKKDSDKYFDGIGSFSNPTQNENDSEIIDEGNALTATSDGGFVLVGTITTTPQKGNGGKDLFLIKVNAVGDIIWIKTMGGAGDEEPAGVTEAANGDIIVCGTNTQGGYSSVFLMRIDRNGELTN